MEQVAATAKVAPQVVLTIAKSLEFVPDSACALGTETGTLPVFFTVKE